MKLGFWTLKVAADKEVQDYGHMAYLNHPNCQSSLDISLIWILLTSSDSNNLQGRLICCDRFFVGFCKSLDSELSFYPTDGTCGKRKMV
jgi:hypothetical protein